MERTLHVFHNDGPGVWYVAADAADAHAGYCHDQRESPYIGDATFDPWEFVPDTEEIEVLIDIAGAETKTVRMMAGLWASSRGRGVLCCGRD